MNDETVSSDRLGLIVQFSVGGIVGVICGILSLAITRYHLLVEMPYTPYYVVSCGIFLAGLAMLYGDRLWSSDHVIPNRKPKHSNFSKIVSYILASVGLLVAILMIILSMSKDDEKPSESEQFVPYNLLQSAVVNSLYEHYNT